MITFNESIEQICVTTDCLQIGEDILVAVYGGDKPHIGAVTLSIPRPSLLEHKKRSASTSILTLIGHKEDMVARNMGETLAAALDKNVVITCGIHMDDISKEEIEKTIEIIKVLTYKIIAEIS